MDPLHRNDLIWSDLSYALQQPFSSFRQLLFGWSLSISGIYCLVVLYHLLIWQVGNSLQILAWKVLNLEHMSLTLVIDGILLCRSLWVAFLVFFGFSICIYLILYIFRIIFIYFKRLQIIYVYWMFWHLNLSLLVLNKRFQFLKYHTFTITDYRM